MVREGEKVMLSETRAATCANTLCRPGREQVRARRSGLGSGCGSDVVGKERKRKKGTYWGARYGREKVERVFASTGETTMQLE